MKWRDTGGAHQHANRIVIWVGNTSLEQRLLQPVAKDGLLVLTLSIGLRGHVRPGWLDRLRRRCIVSHDESSKELVL